MVFYRSHIINIYSWSYENASVALLCSQSLGHGLLILTKTVYPCVSSATPSCVCCVQLSKSI